MVLQRPRNCRVAFGFGDGQPRGNERDLLVADREGRVGGKDASAVDREELVGALGLKSNEVSPEFGAVRRSEGMQAIEAERQAYRRV